jgi:hypothetical protein
MGLGELSFPYSLIPVIPDSLNPEHRSL